MPPSEADVERCERCNARVLWTITAAGNRMAVDPKPADDGNQAVYQDGAGTYKSRGISKDRPSLEGAEWRAKPHVATCANPAPRQPRRPPQTVRRTPWRPR
jgi:hypothetical protein